MFQAYLNPLPDLDLHFSFAPASHTHKYRNFVDEYNHIRHALGTLLENEAYLTRRATRDVCTPLTVIMVQLESVNLGNLTLEQALPALEQSVSRLHQAVASLNMVRVHVA